MKITFLHYKNVIDDKLGTGLPLETLYANYHHLSFMEVSLFQNSRFEAYDKIRIKVTDKAAILRIEWRPEDLLEPQIFVNGQLSWQISATGYIYLKEHDFIEIIIKDVEKNTLSHYWIVVTEIKP